MRSIGHLPDEKQARQFSDFLLTQGIRSEVEPEASTQWLIWVLDDAQLEAGRAWLERFQQNPLADEFSGASAAETLRAQEQAEQAKWRRRVFNRRRVFPGMQNFGAGLLTYALVVACGVIAWHSGMGTEEGILRHFFISYPAEGQTGFLPEVRAGEVWRLFSPMLIHFSPGHVLFNLLWLFQLGSMIESRQGTGRFALLVAVFSVGSNLPQYIFAGPFFGGMSGVNYGLIGYVWLRGKFDPASGLHLDKQSVVMSIAWFFLCFTGWMGPIANYAHAAGLILGMAWGWLSAQWALRNQ